MDCRPDRLIAAPGEARRSVDSRRKVAVEGKVGWPQRKGGALCGDTELFEVIGTGLADVFRQATLRNTQQWQK
jgi:hypothetical protein